MTDHAKEGLLLWGYASDELGVVLSCWLEYEHGERGSWSDGVQMEPDQSAVWTLMHVYLPGSGVDICPVLSTDIVDEIEAWVADRAQSESEASSDEVEIDDYETRKAWEL